MAFRPNWYENESRRPAFGLGDLRSWSGFRWILTLNVAAFLLQMVLQASQGPGPVMVLDPLTRWGALRAFWLDGSLNWLFVPQLVTYAFLHAGLQHIFFNMLYLFFFAPEVEATLGKRGFLRMYLAGAVLGGLAQWLWWVVRGEPGFVVGASGAVYTILAYYALRWPKRQILLWMVIPIPVWIFVVARVYFDLQAFIGGTAGETAVVVHLAGAAVGVAWLRGGAGVERFLDRRRTRKVRAVFEAQSDDRREMDRILGKIQATGLSSLDGSERAFLERRSRELRKGP